MEPSNSNPVNPQNNIARLAGEAGNNPNATLSGKQVTSISTPDRNDMFERALGLDGDLYPNLSAEPPLFTPAPVWTRCSEDIKTENLVVGGFPHTDPIIEVALLRGLLDNPRILNLLLTKKY